MKPSKSKTTAKRSAVKPRKTAAKSRNRVVAKKRSITRQHFDWQGITVAVSYEPDWLGMSAEFPDMAHAHLEIEAVAPERAPLPVTDTGYRSHFLPHSTVEQAGGPVAYARAWLDHAAKAPAWRKRQEESRQLCLF